MAAPTLQWTRQFGTVGSEFGESVASDNAGNAYVSGYQSGIVTPHDQSAAGTFISKFDANSAALWSRRLPGVDFLSDTDLTADRFGNVFVAGNGPLEPTDLYYDIFIVKFDSFGDLAWTRKLSAPGYDNLGGIAVDELGNLFVSSTTQSYSGGAYQGVSGSVLAKYDASGSLLWSQPFGTVDGDSASSVATDRQGNAYVAGSTTGAIGGPNAGEGDAYVTKFDGSGTAMWTKQFGSLSDDTVFDIAVDDAGGIVVSGQTYGDLDISNAGEVDAFVAKLDPDGTLLWTRQFGSDRIDRGLSVDIGPAGNAFVAGFTRGSLAGPASGSFDGFVVEFDATGQRLWGAQLGTSEFDDAYGVSVNSSGNIFVTGGTYGDLAAPNLGQSDIYLAKFQAVPEPPAILLAVGLTSAIVRVRRGRRRSAPDQDGRAI